MEKEKISFGLLHEGLLRGYHVAVLLIFCFGYVSYVTTHCLLGKSNVLASDVANGY